jgi:3-deoxy-D-manno-octulosonic-acid transferase
VGEVLSLQNLVSQLRAKHPSWEIFFSTLTITGYRMARQKLKAVDHFFYIPFDFGWSVRRVMNAVRPEVFVLAESEFWPNLLREAQRQSAAVILANGRMSDRSFRRYRALKRLARRLWPYIDLFLVQSERDKARFEELGVPPARLHVTGNLKSEIQLREWTPTGLSRMKKEIGLPRRGKVIVAGSTREGEEALLLKGFSEGRQKSKDCFLILAPRHPGRVDEVKKLCRSAGWIVRRRTRLRPGQSWDILILDTMGELAHFYALCDAAFVGGSLVPWGGHNILEPAYYGKPVFFGPYMHNFAFLAETFVKSGGARVITDSPGVAEVFLFQDKKALQIMGRQAKQTLASLQGATGKTVEGIEHWMEKGSRPPGGRLVAGKKPKEERVRIGT